jgi:DNA-binding transcriptional regulator YhcF (GntR family)
LRGLTEEEIERLHKEIGREIGLEEGREEMIAKMKAAGLSEEEIRKILETPID